jgi:predicted Rossmann fold nucleotide-binding protein DprA/Smf involved in DNA uptake
MPRHIHPHMTTNVNRFERLVEIERIITGLRAEQRQLLEGALQSERDEPMVTPAKSPKDVGLKTPPEAFKVKRKTRTPGVTTMILTRLQEFPAATASQIAKALGLEAVSVSTTLNRLKKEGRVISSGTRKHMVWSYDGPELSNGTAAIVE